MISVNDRHCGAETGEKTKAVRQTVDKGRPKREKPAVMSGEKKQ